MTRNAQTVDLLRQAAAKSRSEKLEPASHPFPPGNIRLYGPLALSAKCPYAMPLTVFAWKGISAAPPGAHRGGRRGRWPAPRSAVRSLDCRGGVPGSALKVFVATAALQAGDSRKRVTCQEADRGLEHFLQAWRMLHRFIKG